MTWLVTGAGGQVGSVLMGHLLRANRPALGLISTSGPAPRAGTCRRVDLLDQERLSALLAEVRPSVVLHAAAVSTVADAARDPERAHHVNVSATAEIAALAARYEARFLYVSTDMVFDGEHAPYRETDAPSPQSEYGRSKYEGERQALDGGGVVARLPLLYGMPAAPRRSTFLEQVKALRERRKLVLFHDEVRSPLSLEDAALALIRLAQSDASGLFHLGGPERLTRVEMALLTARALGVEDPVYEAVSRLSVPGAGPRPRDLSLSSERYTTVFGQAPGRRMAEALPELLAGAL